MIRSSFRSNDSVRATFAWRADAAVHSSVHAHSRNIPRPRHRLPVHSDVLSSCSHRHASSSPPNRNLGICFPLSGSASFSLLLPTHGYLVIGASHLFHSAVYQPWRNHEPPGHNALRLGVYFCYGNMRRCSAIIACDLNEFAPFILQASVWKLIWMDTSSCIKSNSSLFFSSDALLLLVLVV